MIIRYVEASDYSWLKEHDKHVSDEILRIKIESKEIYVVQDNDEIIGWLRYNLFWDEIPFMNMLYLLENERNKGIGKRLVKYWENDIKNKGYKGVLTSTLSNEKAQHFYRKIGYTEIGGFKYLDEPYEIIFYKKLEKKHCERAKLHITGLFTLRRQ
jgi:ribosomal protein S18 acetylase RimI-like enzyme